MKRPILPDHLLYLEPRPAIVQLSAVKPGDKIRLTGKFLKNTGQRTGREGRKSWIVVACDCDLCATGGFVYTDELSEHGTPGSPYYDAEMRPNRHIAKANVFKVGTADVRNDP